MKSGAYANLGGIDIPVLQWSIRCPYDFGALKHLEEIEDVKSSWTDYDYEAGNPAAAEQWMNEAWQEGHEPTLQSFKYLLRSLRKSSDTVKVETWFERLMQMQLQPDMDCVNEIIGAYVEQENLDKAIEWKAIAKRLGLLPNVETYKLLISTYAKMGFMQEAEDLFEELVEEERPNVDGPHEDTLLLWTANIGTPRRSQTQLLPAQHFVSTGVVCTHDGGGESDPRGDKPVETIGDPRKLSTLSPSLYLSLP
eukprot:Skav213208  [mRNA]  locus=scaffold2826:500216:507192:- [translate_table: standard]